MEATATQVINALAQNCKCLHGTTFDVDGRKYKARVKLLKTREEFDRPLYLAVGSTSYGKNGPYSIYVGIRTERTVKTKPGRELEEQIRAAVAGKCLEKDGWLGVDAEPGTNFWPIYRYVVMNTVLNLDEVDLQAWAKEQCKAFCECLDALKNGL